MSQKKLRPFAEILILVKLLSEDQKLDLLDVLRGRPQRASKAKPKEPKAKLCALPNCGQSESHVNHNPESEDYHLFQPEIKKKGKGAGAGG